MSVRKLTYEIDRARVARYFLWNQVILVAIVGAMFFCVGIALALVYALVIGPWLTRRQAGALRYELDGATLRVDQGVFFLQRKAIPLDRVTDIVLAQGPLMRALGIWALQVQTAGAGQVQAEAVLYGLVDPESVRDGLLRERDRAVAPERGDNG